MMEVTAIIHTRNAERYLQEVIDRLKDFDEIMIVDMESSDATLDIARRNGCRIVPVEPCGYADPLRDYAMRQAKNDWVLFVDADEIIPDQLSEYIRKFIVEPGKNRALMIPRKNYFLDIWNTATYPDYQVRLLDRRACEWPAHVHSKPEVKGRVAQIPRRRSDLAMLHKAPTTAEIIERMNRYTTFEQQRKSNRKITLFTLWFRPKMRFFKSYILKGGWRNGIAGYMSARHDANYQYYYLMKIYEAQMK